MEDVECIHVCNGRFMLAQLKSIGEATLAIRIIGVKRQNICFPGLMSSNRLLVPSQTIYT